MHRVDGEAMKAPLDLDALQAVCDAATPDWKIGGVSKDGAEIRLAHDGFDETAQGYSHWTFLRLNDAKFACAARTALPLLIARVRELEAAAMTQAARARIVETKLDRAVKLLTLVDKHGGICGFVGDIAAEALRAGKDGNDNGK